ncbi:MAG: hypothetical protein KatS3mg087_0408 [Patescibacteria group bacterium]|nr:MAG: hypothetical protein KatS3mg087_0408 [Patescibacteria group bacterium]
MKQYLVLVHGWGQSKAFWQNVIPHLQSCFYVIAVDLPGFGTCPAPTASAWRVHDFADWLHQQLQSLGVSSPILVGHSFGGRICAVYAQKYPTIKLVLYSSSGLYRFNFSKLLFLACNAVALHFFPHQMHVLHSILFKPTSYTNKLIHSINQANFVLKTYLHVNLRDSDLSEIFRTLSTPTLLIYGAKDHIVDPLVGRKLHKLIPNSQLIILPHSTHFASLEESDQFLSCLQTFLEVRI